MGAYYRALAGKIDRFICLNLGGLFLLIIRQPLFCYYSAQLELKYKYEFRY